MLMSIFLQLIFAFAFVALACFVMYKVSMPICLKVIDLCFDSRVFRTGIYIFLALAFCALGIMQLIDFTKGIEPGLSRFFPGSFLCSGLFLFFIFWKRKA